MCQNGLFTICLSLVYNVLDVSKSTSIYCWNHLLTNSGNLVVHLIFFFSNSITREAFPEACNDCHVYLTYKIFGENVEKKNAKGVKGSTLKEISFDDYEKCFLEL